MTCRRPPRHQLLSTRPASGAGHEDLADSTHQRHAAAAQLHDHHAPVPRAQPLAFQPQQLMICSSQHQPCWDPSSPSSSQWRTHGAVGSRRRARGAGDGLTSAWRYTPQRVWRAGRAAPVSAAQPETYSARPAAVGELGFEGPGGCPSSKDRTVEGVLCRS